MEQSHLPPHSPIHRLSPNPGVTTATPIMYKPLDKPIYSSPPPAVSNPENNNCKLIDYRGAKIAAFVVDGRELVCLPQAFDLFLKHLVGGLHTVYTKLKRLDVSPIVCNVEQVRILRGLGAIQPGVNRCKLISCKEFDILYEDCTNSSARPGRPPKRSPSIMSHPETLEKLKRGRMDNGDYGYGARALFDPKKSALLSNGYHYPNHLASLGFMPFGHPMMSPAVSMAMANQLGLRPDGSIIREPVHSDTDMLSPRSKDEKSDDGRCYEDNNNKPLHLDRSLPVSMSDKGMRRHSTTDKESGVSTSSEATTNGQLDLSTKNAVHSGNEDLDDDYSEDDDDDLDRRDPHPHQTVQNGESTERLPYQSHVLSTEAGGVSSIETLLMNIQGLLKVAAENARHHERQVNFEKADLKMDLLRERELREGAEKQLMEEQRNRVALQKRLKKEKKTRRRLQDHLESEMRLRNKMEDVIKQSSPEALRGLAETMSQEHETDRNGLRAEEERKLQDSPLPPTKASLTSYAAITESCGGIQNMMESFLAQSGRGSANGYLHPPIINPETA